MNRINNDSFVLKKFFTTHKSRNSKIRLITAAVGIGIIIILSLTISDFMKTGNILNIFEQLSILGFISIGMTYVMVSGGIDLSVYTVVSAASVVGASIMIKGYSPIFGCIIMIVVGIIFGLINGFAISILRMTPFIVTLSTMVLAQGFAIWFTQAQSIFDLPLIYVNTVAGKIFGIIPVPAVIIIVVAVIAAIILTKTKYGRWIHLMGSNEQTARISGIPTILTKLSVYVFSGIMSGITAIVVTSIIRTATTSMIREERLMDVIAATVIGGASLLGGTGSVLGTMLGLLFLTVLGNCFNLLGVSPFIAMVIKGFILVIIIGLDKLRSP